MASETKESKMAEGLTIFILIHSARYLICLRRVIQEAEKYLIDFAPSDTDYNRRTWELQCHVMRAFLEFV